MANARTHVGKVVVYDDDEFEAGVRYDRIRALVARLAAEGVFEAEPMVVKATFRQECLAALSEGDPAILVADLMSVEDRSPKGARLLRAVASQAGVRDRTWRIALTKRSSPVVASELRGMAHAMVVFRDTNTVPLGEAIVETLKGPAGRPDHLIVRPADAMERHAVERRRVLMELLGPDYTPEMEEAVYRWVEAPFNDEPLDHPSGEPFFLLPNLEREDGDRDAERRRADSTPRMTITELEKHIRSRNLLVSTQHLRHHTQRRLLPLSDSVLRQKLIPQPVQIALRPEVWSQLWEYSDVAQKLWLKQTEHRVAMKFLEAAVRVDKKFPRRAPDVRESYDLVNQVYEDTTYRQELADSRLGNWDASYAVWTIADWALDEDQARRRRASAVS